jgi:membrane-anchored protein YejM (alkaline phosphatase superfamily)
MSICGVGLSLPLVFLLILGFSAWAMERQMNGTLPAEKLRKSEQGW